MKRGILFGFGSEIGCKLVELSLGFCDLRIDTIVNKSNGSIEDNLESLKAKLIFSNPNLLNKIQIKLREKQLCIDGRNINCIFSSIEDFINKKNTFEKYDFGILATNKTDIGDDDLVKKLLKTCTKLFGVAESINHNSVYYPLIELNSKRLNTKSLSENNSDYFALGSCQSIGWTSTLALVISWLDSFDFKNFLKIISAQVEIVHPDTPQGRFGTKSFNPRDQDARNNLRPSFSQVKISMNRTLPDSVNLSPVSLRVCVEPPGYQISRFLILCDENSNIINDLNFNQFQRFLKAYSKSNSLIVNYCDQPYGSKAFSQIKTASTILSSNKYLDVSKIHSFNGRAMFQITTQSFVHNTLGYCNSILGSIEKVINKNNHDLYFFSKD